MSTAPSSSANSENTPILCANKCGFYGNPQTENMCSKCYRDTAKARSVAQPASSTSKPEIPCEHKQAAETKAPPCEGSSSSSICNSNSKSDSPSKAPAPNRCFSCKRKVGVLGFKCRCEHTFCGEHRHADKHECTFDYKAYDRARLEQANPVVAGSKIQKI